MSWNYRIVRHIDGTLGLHEVHYDADGKPWGMTAEPRGFAVDADEGPEVIKDMLKMALTGCEAPVLEEPPAGKWPGKAP